MMKKVIALLLIAVAFIATSCNDSSLTSIGYTFKVHLSGVIDGFPDTNKEAMYKVGGNNHIKVNLLIYDASGMLVKEEETTTNTYKDVLDFPIEMPIDVSGYKAVVITTVVNTTNSAIEYWTLSNKHKLANATITRYNSPFSFYEILGVAYSEVKGSNDNVVTMSVRPGGALCSLLYKNIHTYNDIEKITLTRNQDNSVVKFDANGEITPSGVKKGSFNWTSNELTIDDYPKATGVNGYCFLLPAEDISFKWNIISRSTGEINSTTSMLLNKVEAGKEYVIAIDFNSNGRIAYDAFQHPNSRSNGNINTSDCSLDNSEKLVTLLGL